VECLSINDIISSALVKKFMSPHHPRKHRVQLKKFLTDELVSIETGYAWENMMRKPALKRYKIRESNNI